MRVAVVGATGFVGSRLVVELAACGHRVRALVRDPAKVPAGADVEIMRIDLDTGGGFDAGLEGIDVAVWLVHRMREGAAFADADRESARRFAEACARAGVGRIVYLGGLTGSSVGTTGELSEHLASRSEVAGALASTSVPVTELRASIVLGAGSASFEIMRQLVDHLPVMTTPRWVHNRTQPIAIADLLTYLRRVIETPSTAGRAFDVGGPEVISFADMLRRYARVRGIPVWIAPVPVLTPALSARWIGLVTDVDPALAKPLISSLVHETVVRDDSIRTLIPIRLTTFETAVRDAIDDAREIGLQTRMGRDLRYVQGLAVGLGLNWLSLELTKPGRGRRPDAALGVMYALGLLSLHQARRSDVDLGRVSPETVAAGVASGAGAAAATWFAGRLLVRLNPSFGDALRGTLRRDRDVGGEFPAAALALAGFCEELWWRGALRSPGAGGIGNRDLASYAAWMLPIVASGEAPLALAALTLGPVWLALARHRGPTAAGLSHAVWLAAARSIARRIAP